MKKIIVAPLNWGLGHASRCVPIIIALLKREYTPVLASDGNTLKLLKKEFPNLETLDLPSYHISYGKNLKRSLFFKTFSILKAVKKEKNILDRYLNQNSDVVGIISDNRFGIYSKKIPSVYITHQINVLSGIFTPLTNFFHQRVIKKFNECWIPDNEGSEFSGKLSMSKKRLRQKYIGVLSRLKYRSLELDVDILIVLSGPEPNRAQLEEKLKQLFKETSKKTWLIRGVVEEEQVIEEYGNLKIYNFMQSEELETALNSSKFVICRSGYSSVMDLISLNKKALLIPTKGQNEQEYLANYLQDKGCFRCIKEEDLNKKVLKLLDYNFEIKYEKRNLNPKLFDLFSV
ncbi:MAG: glycosyltransferase [Flavobacteriaceae bacterium]|nr:glycosyltransferase [Flavobacteriaceae bacterium]